MGIKFTQDKGAKTKNHINFEILHHSGQLEPILRSNDLFVQRVPSFELKEHKNDA